MKRGLEQHDDQLRVSALGILTTYQALELPGLLKKGLEDLQGPQEYE